MQIQGTAYLHGPQSMNGPHRAYNSQPPARGASAQPVDQLDISAQADLVSRVRDVPDIRHDRVAAIKAAIANGTYETPEKMDAALDRLLDEMG
jgi:negative regulator of flagellin synthesis FlgM